MRTLGLQPAATDRLDQGQASHLRSAWSVGVLLISLAITLVLYRDVWRDPIHVTLGTVNHTNDPMQMMWFLKWVPWALVHGHNPFRTDALFYPDGVSLAWNTAVPTLGVLAAPLTLTAGPALSFVVLMTLGPPLMALTSFWWLRRYVDRSWPAAVGALLLAFSPYMSGHMLGHLNLVFTGLLPLMLILVEDLLWRRPRSQMRTAVYLGLGDDTRNGIAATASDLQAGRAALCLLSLRAIVVVRGVAEGAQLVDLATDLAGRGPDHVDGGASVWLVQCS